MAIFSNVVLASASTPAANTEFITSEGVFFFNGQRQACQITFNKAVLSGQVLSPINLRYYPSLRDFGIDSTGICNSPSTMPAGEFLLANGTVYFSNGSGQSCQYVNVPSWINVANLAIYPSFPSDLIAKGGVCAGWDGPNQYPATSPPEANSVFITDGGMFFNNGTGHACQITYSMAIRDHRNLSQIGFAYFPSLGQAGIVNDGLCGAGAQQMGEGPFLTANGSIYYSNGLGHACSYSFGGGVDTTGLTMYPSFPSDLLVDDGVCAQSPFVDASGGELGLNQQDAENNASRLSEFLATNSPASIYFRNGIYPFKGTDPANPNDPQPPAFTLGSNVTLAGEGTLASDSNSTRQKVAIVGTLGDDSRVVNSPIVKGTTTVFLTNDDGTGTPFIKSDDVVRLNNYPTGPGDEGSCDEATCIYTGPPNLRQNRRRELLRVATSNLNSVTFEIGVLYDYPSGSGPVFLRKINSVDNVSILGLTLDGLSFNFSYARNLSFKGVAAKRTNLAASGCFQCYVDFSDFDGQGEDLRVDFFEGSFDTKISGKFRGGSTTSDNGVVKLNQVRKAEINAIFNGHDPSGAPDHGIFIDTDYYEAPSGFPNNPVDDIKINATYILDPQYVVPPDINLSGEPWIGSPISNVSITSNGMSLRFAGAQQITTTASGSSQLSISTSNRVSVTGGNFENAKVDGAYELGTLPSEDISLSGVTLRLSPTAPQIYDAKRITLSNVRVDTTPASPGTDIPIIHLKHVSGITIDQLSVSCNAGQSGLKIWAETDVNNAVLVGGAGSLPVPFEPFAHAWETQNIACPHP